HPSLATPHWPPLIGHPSHWRSLTIPSLHFARRACLHRLARTRHIRVPSDRGKSTHAFLIPGAEIGKSIGSSGNRKADSRRSSATRSRVKIAVFSQQK